MQFTEKLVMDGFGYAYGIAAADLTGNGRLDVIASAERGSNELPVWLNRG